MKNEIRLLTFMAILAVLYIAQDLLFPVVLAFLLYFIFNPIARGFCRFKLPRLLVSALIVLSLIGTVAALTSLLAEPARQWLEKAPVQMRSLDKKLSMIKEPMKKLSETTEEVQKITDMSGESTATEVKTSSDLNTSETIMGKLMDLSYGTITSLLLLFFLLVYGNGFLLATTAALSESSQEKNEALLLSVEESISKYLSLVTLINFALGVCIGLAMYILGMPNPLMWGVMAALFNYIPYLGALCGTLVVFFVALITFDSGFSTFLPPLTYFLINGLEGNVITPTVLGSKMSISPLIIVFSLMIFGWMWGVGGVLVCVPILGVCKLIFDEVPSLKRYSRILESRSVTLKEKELCKHQSA